MDTGVTVLAFGQKADRMLLISPAAHASPKSPAGRAH
jgi:hypothetical protein